MAATWLLPFVVDRNPAKQGKYMPGSRIPIVAASRLRNAKPDYVVILPWNLKAAAVRLCCGAVQAGQVLPGSHLPILPPDALRERRPDVVLILPWNIAAEVAEQHGYIRDWGGRFVVAIPSPTLL